MCNKEYVEKFLPGRAVSPNLSEESLNSFWLITNWKGLRVC